MAPAFILKKTAENSIDFKKFSIVVTLNVASSTL
jgi:hypothetical protein